MSTCSGEGNGAASTAKATAKGVRNVTADRRRITFAGSLWRVKNSDPSARGYHVKKPAIHHKSVGFTGGQHDLFMIDRIYETFSLARATGGLVGEFNRAE
jgi:hypothetical protein